MKLQKVQYLALLILLFTAIAQPAIFAAGNATAMSATQNTTVNSTVQTIPPTISNGVKTFTANLLVLPSRIINITDYLILGNLSVSIINSGTNGTNGAFPIYFNYRCGTPTSQVAPYRFSNHVWTISKYSTNESSCTFIVNASNADSEFSLISAKAQSSLQLPPYLLYGIAAAIILAAVLVVYHYGSKPRRRAATKKSMGGLKAQSSVEYVLIFAISIIILITAVSFAGYSIYSGKVATYAPSSCFITAQLRCVQLAVTYNSVSSRAVLELVNDQPVPITFSQNSLEIIPTASQQSYSGSCYPANALPGATITCVADMKGFNKSLGTQLEPSFRLSFTQCEPNSCARFSTTGTSNLYVSPPIPTYTITLLTSPSNGHISVNGEEYPSGTQLYFTTGSSYSMLADPPGGTSFVKWTSTSGISLSSTSSASTTVTITSNGILTAIFTPPPTITISPLTSSVNTLTLNCDPSAGCTALSIYSGSSTTVCTNPASPCTVQVAAGNTVYIAQSPDPSYAFSSWTGHATSPASASSLPGAATGSADFATFQMPSASVSITAVYSSTTTPPPASLYTTFTEQGLAMGCYSATNCFWSVNYNGNWLHGQCYLYSGADNGICEPIVFNSIAAPSGQHSFVVDHSGGNPPFYPNPASGTLAAGSNQLITFSEQKAETTFTENGLPQGYTWSVTYAGTTESASAGNPINFITSTGSYSFSVPVSGAYTPNPPTGTLSAGSSEQIIFSTNNNAHTVTLSCNPSADCAEVVLYDSGQRLPVSAGSGSSATITAEAGNTITAEVYLAAAPPQDKQYTYYCSMTGSCTPTWSYYCTTASTTCKFTMPSQDVVETANFKPLQQWCLITYASPSSGGTTSPIGISECNYLGNAIPISATASPGYTFSFWSGLESISQCHYSIGSDTAASASVVCTSLPPTSTVTLYANFVSTAKVCYGLNIVGGAGVGQSVVSPLNSPGCAKYYYDPNTQVSITPRPESGYYSSGLNVYGVTSRFYSTSNPAAGGLLCLTSNGQFTPCNGPYTVVINANPTTVNEYAGPITTTTTTSTTTSTTTVPTTYAQCTAPSGYTYGQLVNTCNGQYGWYTEVFTSPGDCGQNSGYEYIWTNCYISNRAYYWYSGYSDSDSNENCASYSPSNGC